MSKVIFAVTLILLIFGLVILSSAGIVEGQKKFGSAYYYLNHQILYGVLPGLALMFLFSKIDYKFWKKISLPILFATFLLMNRLKNKLKKILVIQLSVFRYQAVKTREAR